MSKEVRPMQYTSAEAAKLLRKTKEELAAVLEKENKAGIFTAAVGENIEDVRPAYDFAGTREKVKDYHDRIRKIKHAMNEFNLRTLIPEFSMTIDEMLVYIPQLSAEKSRLETMAAALPKERVTGGYAPRTIVEYNYANYNPEEAAKALESVSDELAKAQTALDVVNNSVKFDINI